VIEQGDKNRNVVFETLTDLRPRYAIVQTTCLKSDAGDCRVILVDGEPVRSLCSALPMAEITRQPRGRGARREPAASPGDRCLCPLSPEVKAAGMIFVGWM